MRKIFTCLTLLLTLTTFGQDSEEFCRTGKIKYDNNDYDGAKFYLDKAIELKTNNADIYILRGNIKSKLNDAKGFFERDAAASSDVKIKGWSHLYLGRILDMKEHRQEAVEHYRAALTAGGSPELKAAAEKGLQQAYEPPAKRPID